jgi:predicted ester cyclase
MQTQLEKNKAIVTRFNREVIEQGSLQSFRELVAENVVNHAAPPGTPNGAGSMIHFILELLRTGFPDVKVEILAQIAEGDLVTSRKVLRATHTGEFMGIAPSHKRIAFHVIDIIRLENGKYAEHWGMSNLADILKEIQAPAH